MGFHHQDIRKKCTKCTYHELRLIPGSDFHVDYCKLGDCECATIKSCDCNGKAWIKVKK